MEILKLIPFLVLFGVSEEHCQVTSEQCRCTDIALDKFHKEFFKNVPSNIATNFSIMIENSTSSNLDYFPTFPVYRQDLHIISLTIKNSSIENIGAHAFEELIYINQLDLSQNKLKDISFVQHLPESLLLLDISHNNIAYTDNVFQKELQFLDLSYNKITILDLSALFQIKNLNLAHNAISKIIPRSSDYFCNTIHLNLSYNAITIFNEEELRCTFDNVDLSFNKLNTIKLMNEKTNYNLRGNKLKHIKDTPVFKELDLSELKSTMDPEWKFLVRKKLKINNNKLQTLTNQTIRLREVMRRGDCRPSIDISNSSILHIGEHYFSYFNIPILNLSYNSLSLLRSNMFTDSSFDVLDLSHNQIKMIRYQAFVGLSAKLIDLSHNEITITKNILENTIITKVDLSFNKIKSVFGQSFLTVKNLRLLNFSNCQIEVIENDAFLGLNDLETLDISYNKLVIIEQNSFFGLSITELILKGNSVNMIRTKAFNNLYNINNLDLRDLNITHLEQQSFYNLPNVTTIDLSNNNLTTIPLDLIQDTPNLETVIFSNNVLTSLNPFSNKLKLKSLTLKYQGTFEPKKINNINLRTLILEDCKIDILKNNSFDGLYNLEELYFTNSDIDTVEPGSLNHLYVLEQLDAQSLFKNQRNIKQNIFNDLRSLQNMDLSMLNITTIETKSFLGLLSLKNLLLNNNKIKNITKETFLGLESLEILDLSFNKLNIYNNIFEGLENLKELYLNNNEIEIIESNFSDNLPQLKILNLNHNNIKSVSITSLSMFGNLLELYMQYNYIHTLQPGTFQNLSELKIFNVSYNEIKMFKNGEFSNLRKLEILDLSYNEILKIDHENIFYSMRKLQKLYLDGNHLKTLDFARLLNNLKQVNYIGISNNKWNCENLSFVIEALNNKSVSYEPAIPDYKNDNIDGISCIDICKYLNCLENDADAVHFY